MSVCQASPIMRGVDFGEYDQPVKMLFRACVSVTGLSELATRLETRLRKEEA